MQASPLRPCTARRLRRPFPDSDAPKCRRGFTLVEMLVAMALTLIMVYAIAEFYAYVGDSVRDGRAMIEMGGQLRAASQRLKRDLDSLTVRVVPWTDDGNTSGYFEYFEGPHSDTLPLRAFNSSGVLVDGTSINDATGGLYDLNAANSTNLLGDGDDILAFTITSGAEPFVGRYQKNTTDGVATSRYAEVIWWTAYRDVNSNNTFDADEPRFLVRRQLVIAPNLGYVYDAEYDTLAEAEQKLYSDYYPENDVAAKIVAVQKDPMTIAYRFYAVKLEELTQREHRFAHLDGFPGSFDFQNGALHSKYLMQSGSGKGEDIVLSNLLAFDVRAYDPAAPVHTDSSSTVAVAPGDPGFDKTATVVSRGAYVDLNWDKQDSTFGPSGTWDTFTDEGTDDRSFFSARPHALAGSIGNTYDTWALSYERASGKAMNGLDDDNQNGVDDPGERVTSPPYPYPLRGIQVKIRIYDPSSRQMKQATVVADFVDE